MRIWNRLCDLATLRVLTLLVVSLVTCHPATAAQAADRMYKIGFLGQTSAADLARQTGSLRQGLRALGYEEGKNLVIEYRWAERKLDRLRSLAAELVDLNVERKSDRMNGIFHDQRGEEPLKVLSFILVNLVHRASLVMELGFLDEF